MTKGKSVVNVVVNTFETLFANWLNVHQILDSLSGLGKVLLHGGIEDKVN
jgi:hypothetical protein